MTLQVEVFWSFRSPYSYLATPRLAEIAAASHEQSAGIDQVNKAVMQLDELTQQNAALVEEATAASQTMAEQAKGLNDSMQRFHVNAAAAPAAAPVAARASDSPRAERRKAGRPWTSRNQETAEAPVARKAAASAADDSVWKEF